MTKPGRDSLNDYDSVIEKVLLFLSDHYLLMHSTPTHSETSSQKPTHDNHTRHSTATFLGRDFKESFTTSPIPFL